MPVPTDPIPDFATLRDAPALDADPRPGTRALHDSALGVLGIELVECSATRVVGRMPIVESQVSSGLLLVLAETVASTAAGWVVGISRRAFGAELDGAWLCAPATGMVVAAATPLATDEPMHVWRIDIVDAAGSQVFTGRCTLGVVEAPA